MNNMSPQNASRRLAGIISNPPRTSSADQARCTGPRWGGRGVPSDILSPHHIHIGLSDPSSLRNSFTSTSSSVAPTRCSRAMRSRYPISSSVQLVAIKGLEPALAPGAAPLAMDLLVRVSNGHFHDEYREGGGITVFYAGVPLAHGSTPNFRVGAKATHTFTVKATAKSVGVPEDLFRLMSAERRWGTAQLQVQMQLGWPGWESFAWSLDLDGREPGTASPSLYPRF
ncbi:hypothetical protein BS78_K302000 [Paspalum vaginatum]|uniref:Late embryogenesis abundant protein LEA-2 subgroup domain-containing protein n=1 Tax=Paspalum vaginatum TaxID=158149 RepID=A0A9W8CDP0_9POAL|nr:hypothetical protein BS78_K302000 [Paspalum vaginatum]